MENIRLWLLLSRFPGFVLLVLVARLSLPCLELLQFSLLDQSRQPSRQSGVWCLIRDGLITDDLGL